MNVFCSYFSISKINGRIIWNRRNKKDFEDEISLWERVHINIKKIVEALAVPQLVSISLFEFMRPGRSVIDDFDRFKNMLGMYRAYCENYVYSLRYTRVIANIWNFGIRIERFKSMVIEVCEGEIDISDWKRLIWSMMNK